jgi:toxin ParE1/3/4
MREVIKRPQAKRDLMEHADYIAQNSMDASDRFLKATDKALRQIAEMPGIGASRDFHNPELAGLRVWPVPGFRRYLIFYRATEDQIEIIRVLHSARDIRAIFEEEE